MKLFRATEESEEKGGSFDATGAFHAPGSSEEDDDNETPGEKLNEFEDTKLLPESTMAIMDESVVKPNPNLSKPPHLVSVLQLFIKCKTRK